MTWAFDPIEGWKTIFVQAIHFEVLPNAESAEALIHLRRGHVIPEISFSIKSCSRRDIHSGTATVQGKPEVAQPSALPEWFLVFDDYGFPSCPGARAAVDDFFRSKPEVPLVLPTGQAVIIKLP